MQALGGKTVRHTDLLLATWQTKVFDLLMVADKIDQQTVDHVRSWPHSGFSAGSRTASAACEPSRGQEGLAENEADSVIAAESGESGHILIDRSALTAQRSADDGPRVGYVST